MIEKKQISITTQGTIPLGRQGEGNVREILFPQTAALLAESWLLLHQRAGDMAGYPVPLEKRGNALVWTVTSGDTFCPGNGRAELTCTDRAGGVLKSQIYTTTVLKSMAGGGEVPDPVKPWYDAIMEALEEGTDVNVTELDALSALMDTGVVDPMADENGAVYTDEAGNLYSY